MTQTEIQKIAKALAHAEENVVEVDRFTLTHPDLPIATAYQIQDELLQILTSRGDTVIGLKMGLTSRAKMKQMGVEAPIYGVLTRKMKIEDGARITLQGRIHPKIEPEVAFLVEKEIHGKMTDDQILDACSGVCGAMEIIDSRYRDFNFLLPDVIADNCSSSGFILGSVIKNPREVDLGNLGILMEVNGKAVQFGSSSAILGHPLDSLKELAKMLADRGRTIPAGSIVLAGAATAAIPLEPGTEVKTSVQDLGNVTVRVSAPA